MSEILKKLNLMSFNGVPSLTNIPLAAFSFIIAFRLLFAGLHLTYGTLLDWTLPDIDLATTLPLLYTIGAYSHKRSIINSNLKKEV